MNAALAVLAGAIVAMGLLAGITKVRDMVRERTLGGLDLIPLAILGLAAARVDHARRPDYKEEWLAELNSFMRSAEGMPITRLARGMTLAIGLLTVKWPADMRERRLQRLAQRFASASAWRITDIAAALAGRKRRALREEWHTHLTGEPGDDLSARRKVTAAIGFVRGAVKMRLRDAADLAWKPADTVLRSRPLSNLFVLMPTVTVAVFILCNAGILGLLQSMESITATGAVLYALVRCGRWWRDVKPPDPKPRTKD